MGDIGILVINIYVDDLIVWGDNEDEIYHVKVLMKQKFYMKDLGDLHYFMGIENIRTPNGMWLSHRQYVLDMLGIEVIFTLNGIWLL